jgi:hypothetical protein
MITGRRDAEIWDGSGTGGTAQEWAWSTGTAPPSKALISLSYLDLVARCQDSLVEQRPETWVSLQGEQPAEELQQSSRTIDDEIGLVDQCRWGLRGVHRDA